MSIGLAAAAGTLSAARLPQSSPPRAPQAPTVLDGLTLYSGGNFESALAPVRTTADIEAVYNTLATRGATWIDQRGDAGDPGRRRLMAASFALEVAAARRVAAAGDFGKQRDLRIKLITWGAAALTTAVPVFSTAATPRDRAEKMPPAVAPPQNVPALPSEATWFQTAVVVLENLDAWEAVIELPTALGRGGGGGAPQRAFPLVPFALARWPRDGALLMARAVAEERIGCAPDHCPLGTFRQTHAPATDPDAMSATPEPFDVASERRGLIKSAAAHFKALVSSDVVSLEANLRYARVQLVLGDGSLARQYLADARRLSADPAAQYVSQLLEGVSWENDGQMERAETAYRAALAAAPGARLAATRLAALLFVKGQAADARAILDASLGPDHASVDPWVTFAAGDGHLATSLLANLRTALK